MVALVLLFTGGVAASQMAPLPFQNSIAWGGPIQPEVGGADNRSQPVISPGVGVETPADISADTPGDTPADSPAGRAADSPTNSPANNTVSANPDNTVRQLGTPFPLQLQPEGLKIGPFYLTNISDSFFYAVNNSQGQPTQTFAGNSATANLVYSRPLSRGILAIQAREQFSLSQSQPYFNQSVVANFNEQLTDRWSLNASASFTYFQSSILANPQYLLGYTQSGLVQQTLFVQQRGYTMYESNNISLSYSLGERTQITFSPILGATYTDQQGGWSNVHQLGGGVSVTRTLTSNLSLSGFYAIYYSATSGAASSSPGWVNQNLGVSFQGTFLQYRGWSLGGSCYVSSQRYGGSGAYTLTPAGTLRLMKRFGESSSITAAYTRTEASNILVSSGYYDQGDIGYTQKIGGRVNVNAGVGEYRISNAGTHQYGKRVGGGVSYQWTPRVSLNAGYNFAHQSGTLASNFSPFLGNVSYFSVGLTWILGGRSGL